MTSVLPEPREWLPPDLLDGMRHPIDHRDDLYRMGCRAARAFCAKGIPEPECLAWLLDGSGMAAVYTKRQYEYQLERAVRFAYDSFMPGGAAAATPPCFIEGLQRLKAAVEESKVRDKKYLLGLIQHAVNTGHNPVHCSSRQLAALVGVKSWGKANDAMSRLESTLAGGFLKGVTHDGVIGHSRLWHLNASDREGYIYTMHDIYVPPPTPEQRFVEWVSDSPLGTDFTITSVAKHLNVSRAKARALLDLYLDVYFGGGFYRGGRNRRQRLPAKWWRKPTAVLFPALPKPKPERKPKTPVSDGFEELVMAAADEQPDFDQHLAEIAAECAAEIERMNAAPRVDPRSMGDPFTGLDLYGS